jgi:3-dehydroquinate synthase/shikimate kinase/3-dehydroquinate synthase
MLPDGDAAKTLGTVETAYEWLSSLGMTRDDLVVAVGGGALTDVAGFVAATYLRGVEVSYLPTTLLGAVDAAVGGKTGVNVGGKNLVGVFRHPARIVVDLEILSRLPEQLLREGAAETVKAGFIADPEIVEEYERAGLAASLDRVVPAAIKVKVDTVRADFGEQGLRAILNYGHTIGHAVEIAAGISHGEAVAIGMVAAGRVAEILVGFEQAERQRETIRRLGLPVSAPPVKREHVELLMNRDKKRDRGGIRMVLLESFGSPVLRHVDGAVIDEGLAAIGIT